jgi:hypothetical protein
MNHLHQYFQKNQMIQTNHYFHYFPMNPKYLHYQQFQLFQKNH